ncbi:MAG: type II toxin-antitoxin system HicA family toxin [Nitrospinae bacterium]|nr:type II toxin-antitoxin system HicA family toxin [Nitrospinota bacterium]MBI3813005.1 type II toxin-antitoxin system HicA family toxin [Nitrospinota bacterium]
MPKLPVVSSKEVIRILRKIGFEYAPKRGKGSHLAFVKKNRDKTRLVIVPKRSDIPKGTLLAILDQAGLTKDEFIDLL